MKVPAGTKLTTSITAGSRALHAVHSIPAGTLIKMGDELRVTEAPVGSIEPYTILVASWEPPWRRAYPAGTPIQYEISL